MKQKKASKMMYIIIPDDIIMGIFLRLPAKYVFKLRCVCKYWYNLISNPDFIKLHLHHHQHVDQTNHSILVFDYSPSTDYDHHTMVHSLNYYYKNNSIDDASPAKWVSISTPINWKLQNGSNYVPLGSCNGLLCIFTSESAWSSGNGIRVLNPCTKQCKELPQLDHERIVPAAATYGHSTYGFGYDRINDDYKLVKNFSQCSLNCNVDYITVVNVYTLRTNSWRRIEDVLHCKLKYVGVLVGGALYWRGKRRVENRLLDYIIVGFELGDEVLKEISFPPSSSRAQSQHLLELNGCLSTFQVTSHDTIEVWSLMNSDDDWVHLFTIAEPKLVFGRRWTPLGASNEDGELLIKVENRELVWYNPRDGKTRFFAKIPNSRAVVKYTESLVSLKYPRW